MCKAKDERRGYYPLKRVKPRNRVKKPKVYFQKSLKETKFEGGKQSMSKKIISAILAMAMIVSMSVTAIVGSLGAAAATDYEADRDM